MTGKNWALISRSVSDGAGKLRDAHPALMKAFSGLGAATYPDGALPNKTKELMALAIGISLRCDGCVGYHAMACQKLGATREEVAETIAVAIQMGGGPSMVYGAEALEAFDQHVTAAELA